MGKKKDIRQKHLVAMLEQNAAMRVNELADALSVTAETVRRDLDEMTALGIVSRTYGGALLRTTQEPSVNYRHNLLVREREAIARCAVESLKDARLIMMGSGATTLHVARRIAVEMNAVTIITHSFGVATVLSLNPGITVMMAPGVYHAGEGAMHGAQTMRYLEDYQADWAVLGASGLAVDGATDALIEAGNVYSAMSRHASRTMIVADNSKFDKVFAARYVQWSGVDELVTDKPPAGKLASAIAGHHTRVRLAVLR